MSKANQQTLLIVLRDLLQAGEAGTQDQICQQLQNQGFDVNQSTISRYLRKIGAVKTKNEEGHIVYFLSKEPAPPTAYSTLSHLVLQIAANESMIVIHTSPGSASLFARLVDYHREKLGILGTVAGDDTIFITPKSLRQIDVLLAEIKSLLSE